MRLRTRCLNWLLAGIGLLAARLEADVFVSSYLTHRVFRFDEQTGAFLGLFLPNTDQRLSYPHGLAFGPEGRLYVASAGNNSILRYDGETGAFHDAFIPNGRGGLHYPVALVFRPDGRLYVTSQLSHQILRYDAITGDFLDVFVSGIAELQGPSDLKFGPDGDLYVVGRFSNRVVRCDGTTGAHKSTFAAGHVSQPFGLQQLPSGDWVVMSGDGNRGMRFAADGSFRDSFLVHGGLSLPVGVSLGPDGALWVANFNQGQMNRFDSTTGAFLSVAISPHTSGLSGPNFFTFRTLVPPALTLSASSTTVTLYWTDPGSAWSLESRTHLNQAHWAPVGLTPVSHLGTQSVTVPTKDTSQFFRLHRP